MLSDCSRSDQSVSKNIAFPKNIFSRTKYKTNRASIFHRFVFRESVFIVGDENLCKKKMQLPSRTSRPSHVVPSFLDPPWPEGLKQTPLLPLFFLGGVKRRVTGGGFVSHKRKKMGGGRFCGLPMLRRREEDKHFTDRKH